MYVILVNIDKVRYTSEILKSWYSGRDNDKLNILPVPGDTLFHSFNRTYGRKIHIYGGHNDLNLVLPRPYDDLVCTYTK